MGVFVISDVPVPVIKLVGESDGMAEGLFVIVIIAFSIDKQKNTREVNQDEKSDCKKEKRMSI